MKKTLLLILTLGSLVANAQYSRQDTLRGSITPERAWWDLVYYHLDVEVIPSQKFIKGSNRIVYQVLKEHDRLQIDLQAPLKITRIEQDGKDLSFVSEGNAHFVSLPGTLPVGEIGEIKVHYEGNPTEAVRAPWDGGFTWTKDSNGNDFVATSCQGIGASIWWPCKDHMYDEVDSMMISVEVPQHLTDVSNGRLREVERNRKKKTKTYHWFVSNPINNYGVNVNIGDYVNWSEAYPGEKGSLDLDYWVLKENEEKARDQFKQTPGMLDAFEHWFGPYPFYEDGFKLVEVPYLGMEHQSSVTYGNKFQNGYLGRDLSGTGWGLKWDFIIIHEAGHEWFANNVTHQDAADMWIHESFTAYSEGLYTEYHFGKDAGQTYTRGTRINIANKFPVIGPYGVNTDRHDTDVYYKGANMLNTLRAVIGDDEKWRSILRGLGEEFYHQTVSSKQVEDFMATKSGLKLGYFFDQYLRDTRVPVFEYFFQEGNLFYRWTNVVDRFDMPIDILTDGDSIRLTPSSKWQQLRIGGGEMLSVDPNFYVAVMRNQP